MLTKLVFCQLVLTQVLSHTWDPPSIPVSEAHTYDSPIPLKHLNPGSDMTSNTGFSKWASQFVWNTGFLRIFLLLRVSRCTSSVTLTSESCPYTFYRILSFSFLIFKFNYLCVNMCMHVYESDCGGQRRLSDPLELKSYTVVNCPTWVLKPYPGALKAASSLNQWTTSPANLHFIFTQIIF